MSLLKTTTPTYHGQNGQTMARPPDWIDWVSQLFRTPTPEYLEAPVHAARTGEQELRR